MVLVSFVDGLDDSKGGKYKAKNQEKRELRYQQYTKICKIEEYRNLVKKHQNPRQTDA